MANSIWKKYFKLSIAKNRKSNRKEASQKLIRVILAEENSRVMLQEEIWIVVQLRGSGQEGIPRIPLTSMTSMRNDVKENRTASSSAMHQPLGQSVILAVLLSVVNAQSALIGSGFVFANELGSPLNYQVQS